MSETATQGKSLNLQAAGQILAMAEEEALRVWAGRFCISLREGIEDTSFGKLFLDIRARDRVLPFERAEWEQSHGEEAYAYYLCPGLSPLTRDEAIALAKEYEPCSP